MSNKSHSQDLLQKALSRTELCDIDCLENILANAAYVGDKSSIYQQIAQNLKHKLYPKVRDEEATIAIDYINKQKA